MLFVYAVHSITPFGDFVIYRSDLYQQYAPLLSELYDRVKCGESLVYSWNSGLGGNFLGCFFNYLSSPFNILIFIFKREDISLAISMIIAIKAILSSVSMAYYLKKSQKTNNISIVAFGLMYAFCAYFVAYYWNLMWLDAIYLLPLIVLGIEKIIDNGKCINYIICLSLAIYSNYYIGFMLCIFSCIYFIYYYVCSADKFKQPKSDITEKVTFIKKIKNSNFIKSGIKFACSSLLVGGILSVMLIVVANALSHSSATSGGEIPPFEIYFNIYDFLANHLACITPTIFTHSWNSLPNVYCGMLTLVLLLVFFLSKEIKKREKIISAIIILFMFLSFTMNYANGLWHGGHFPNGLPFRQSFMYSFIVVVFAFKIFIKIDKLSKKTIVISGSIVIAFVIIVLLVGSRNVEIITIIVSLIFVVFYTALLISLRKKTKKTVILLILTFLVIVEIIISSVGCYKVIIKKSEMVFDYNDFHCLHEKIDKQEELLFYREELANTEYPMSSCWYDFNGVSVFNSMTSANVCKMQQSLGLLGNRVYNRVIYNPQTPVYNAMFSIKYIYNKETYLINGDYYGAPMKFGSYHSSQNNYALSIAYPTSKSILNWNAVDYANPVETQQEYFKRATGVSNVYNYITDYEILYENIVPLKNINEFKNIGDFTFKRDSILKNGNATIRVTAQNDENIYVYIKTNNLSEVHIESPTINKRIDFNMGYILDLGHYTNGEIINLNFIFPKELATEDEQSYDIKFIAFTINKDAFVEGYKTLKDGQLEYTEFNDTLIKGNFEIQENEILYTSIPYDEAWEIYIDGKKVDNKDIVAISNALIGVKSIAPGYHEITMEYKNIGLVNCLAIPIVVIIISLAILLIKKFAQKKKI